MPKKRRILFDPTKLWMESFKTDKDIRDILHRAETEKDAIILKCVNEAIHKETPNA